MDDGLEGNAMTEVALALAMAFFSIMVLAMVSMAAGRAGATNPESAPASARPILKVDAGRESLPQAADQRIVIFHKGAYLNPDLTPFVATTEGSRRLVLAIDPGASVSEALSARAGLGRLEATMTVLDQSWTQRLKGVGK